MSGPFGFEMGKSEIAAIFPEIIICFVQIHLGIGKGKAVHFPKPGEFGFILCRGVMKFFTGFPVIGDAVAKHFVIDKSGTAKCFRKHGFLIRCGIQSVAICLVHPSHLPCVSMYLRIISIGAPPVVSRQ